jgi:hypothetical protein
MTNYIARRLVEREQALATDWRGREATPSSSKAPPPGPRTAAKAGGAAEGKAVVAKKRGWLAAAGDLFGFLLLTLGAITFIALVAASAFTVWDTWGRAFWSARFGAPPI